MLSGEGLIAVVNPRPRLKRDRKGRFLKRGHGGHHKARRNTRRRSSSHHKARRRSARRSGGHHVAARYVSRRRRARHNPRFRLPSAGGITSAIGGAAIGASGALALDLALNFGAPYLPAVMVMPGWGRNLTRLAGAFLIGMLSGFVVKPATRNAITAGALVVVTYDITKQLANQYVLPPTMQLGGEDYSAGSYPYAGYNPYLTGLGRGGSSGYSGDAAGGSFAGYLPRGAPVRTSAIRRAISRTATMSAFLEPEAAAASLGADLDI